MSAHVVDLFPHQCLVRRAVLPRPAPVNTHQRAAIRDDVCIVTLVRALASHGLTFSNDPALGIVIHPLPQEAG